MFDSNHSKPTEEQIQQRAYELYEARGREHGRDFDDWITAETELTGQGAIVTPKTKSAGAG